MTDSGGIKAIITSNANLTPGEDRTLRWVAKDADGVNITDFTGWEFGWYMAKRQRNARPQADSSLRLITKVTDSGITDSVPNIDVALDPDDTTDLEAGSYFYGLWRTDTDDVIRLAYGPITFID
jgi:hypothetical protein